MHGHHRLPRDARPRLGGALTFAALVALAMGCTPGATAEEPRADPPAERAAPASAAPDDYAEIERAVERIRAATARFKWIDSAFAEGYPRDVPHCMANPPEGGMGYHFIHPTLMDAEIELERPEILVYARTAGGDFELTGVEYAVPLDRWTEAEPPTVMGQPLKRAPSLGIWYLHVWVWRENPKGLFEDWNPSVEC
jgi:hypothetical protein